MMMMMIRVSVLFVHQLSVVESNRDQGLFGLYRELNNAKALLAKLDEAVHRSDE